MKKSLLIFFCVLSLLVKKVDGQITLDYSNDTLTFSDEFYCANLGEDEYKYISLDYHSNSFKIYNLDMSLFMDVQNPFSNDSIITRGFTVIYVTRTLFDCDTANIEYVLTNPLDKTLLWRENAA